MKLVLTQGAGRWWSDIGLGMGTKETAKEVKEILRKWINNSPPSKEK